MSKVIAVVGPTAVGKSSTGVELALRFNGEVINGDSIQVYKELDIGSAKTTEEEMKGVPHHLLDFLTVGEDFNVQLFQKLARSSIRDIEDRGKLPVIVGGTGLYVKALLYDYDFVKMNTELDEYEDESTKVLYQRLLKLDKPSAEKIHPNNRRRIVRALQMAESGNLKSEQEEGQKHEMIYDCYLVGLTISREILKERIDRRVDQMFETGLVQEVTALHEKYNWNDHGLHGIGYKEFAGYFNGEKSLDEVRQDIKTHTRQFAKRQYTWWNNQMPVNWYDTADPQCLDNIIRDIEKWLNE